MCHNPMTIGQVTRTQNKTIPDDWDIQNGFTYADYDFVFDLGDRLDLRNDLVPHRQSSNLSAVRGSQL